MVAVVAAPEHQQVAGSSRPTASEVTRSLAAVQRSCSDAHAHARARYLYKHTEILRAFQIPLRGTPRETVRGMFLDDVFHSEKRSEHPSLLVREEGARKILGYRASKTRFLTG